MFKKPKSRASSAPNSSVIAYPVTALEERWKDEPAYRSLQQSLTYSDTLNCEKFTDNILDLHKNRNIRAVESHISIAMLTEISFEESQTRSNIVGILIRVKNSLRKIETCRKNAKIAVMSGDHHWLSENVKTASDKNMLVESLLSEADTRLTELQTVIEIGDTVIADIDKSSYTLKAAKEGLELEYKTEATLNGRSSK